MLWLTKRADFVTMGSIVYDLENSEKWVISLEEITSRFGILDKQKHFEVIENAYRILTNSNKK